MNFLQKSWVKLMGLFKQGLGPKELALSITISLVVSLFPIFGIATIVLTALSLRYKINLPIMIVISYLVEPLKVLLFIPFLTIGSYVFVAEHTLVTFEAIKLSYEVSFFSTAKALSYELLCGVIGWSISVLPIAVAFYFVLKVMLSFFVKLTKPSANNPSSWFLTLSVVLS